MIKLSNRDVAETLKTFSNHGLECVFLVPTATGISKSILDATSPIRSFLKRQRVHDFDAQPKGQDSKVVSDALIVYPGAAVPTTVSLYRPETKDGDPRMWISKLGEHATPTDLLAILVSGRKLVVVNCSKGGLEQLLSDRRSSFWQNYETASQQLPADAQELLAKLCEIGSKGFVPSLRQGDTGVGYTLETLLGIKANSKKAPDYKGIEIKAARASSHAKGRSTMFSQVPDWGRSRLKGSKQLLLERGKLHPEKNRLQLFHEIDARGPNSYGLMLQVDEANDDLYQVFTATGQTERDVVWAMQKLVDRLQEKHKQTFWVTAAVSGNDHGEQFHYTSARYTSGASPENFSLLLDAGVISLDYTIKQLPTGAAKDQGYLFKIRQSDLQLLFRAPVAFKLH
jgi:hypothetical protein